MPLGEDAERYEVDILDGGDVVRTLAATTPSVTYTTAQQTTDFGSPQPGYAVRIYQLSASFGRGQARETIVHEYQHWNRHRALEPAALANCLATGVPHASSRKAARRNRACCAC